MESDPTVHNTHVDEQMRELWDEFEIQSNPAYAAGKDVRIAAFSEAMLQEWENEDVQSLLSTMYAQRSDYLPPSAAARLINGAVHFRLLYPDEFIDQILSEPTTSINQRPESGYPRDYDKPEAWRQAIRQSFENDYGNMFVDLVWRRVQGNLAQRYKAVKLVMRSAPERFSQRPMLMDVGCSQNQGLKMLAAHLPFKPVTAGSELEELADGYRLVADQSITSEANDLLNQSLCIGLGIGVDVVPIRDIRNKLWAKACSFYPSELLDTENVAEYERLEALDETTPNSPVRNISFLEADILEPRMQEVAGESKTFDAVVLCTMMYQLQPSSHDRLLDVVERYVKKDGLVIIQDFARFDATAPNNMNFESHWFKEPFPYTTFVWDMKQPETGPQELFRWEGGRCNQLLVGLGSASVTEAVHKIAD